MALEILTLIAFIVLFYGLVSKFFEDNPITPPMVFVLCGFFFGKFGLGWLSQDLVNYEIAEKLFEFALVLLLFVDGAKIDIRDLKKNDPPYRLLGLGIPLSLIFGSLAAKIIFPAFTYWEAGLLAALLTPTDIALGNVAISHKKVPKLTKETITIESGLNDGIIVPIALFLSFCQSMAGSEEYTGYWMLFFLKQFGFGILIGTLIGYLGALALAFGCQKNSITRTFMHLSEASLAILAYSIATFFEGNGFIAAFIAGIATQATPIKKAFQEATYVKEQSELLQLLTFFIFGAFFMPQALLNGDLYVFLYACLSLTMIRVTAAFLSLTGTSLPVVEKLFLSWMGPRGIASLVLGLIIINTSPLPSGEKLFHITAITVTLSIFIHGLTVAPVIKACFGRRAD